MKKRFLFNSLVIIFIASLTTLAADWKPAPSPLMTRWGKAVNPQNAHREYPRPQMMRKNWLNLNGLWEYAVTAKNAETPNKFDGQILVPFCIESALSGVGKVVKPEEALWYRRTFAKPNLKAGERLLLHFGAVDWHAKVFINDKLTGEHKGGFDPFTFDITEALKKSGEQELRVWVWDPTDTGAQPRGKQVLQPGSIWYTSVTGIWQTAWLESVPAASIERLTVTPDVDGGLVEVGTAISGAQNKQQVKVTVYEKGKAIASLTGSADKPLRIKISNPKLWSPDSPFLYDLTVELIDGKRVIDRVTSYVGMRKIEARKASDGILRLFLNNQPLFQIGPLDQGWWPDGLLTPPSEEGMVYDVQILKKLGFNMLRKHVKVEPATFYYNCDKLGMLIWQDMPSGIDRELEKQRDRDDSLFKPENKTQFRAELKALIDAFRHFPCIVVWVPFNEGWGQHDTNEITEWVMSYDRTRLVNGPSGWTDRGVGHLKDMHKYPGPDMFPVMDTRVSVLGEFGGLGLPIENHLWKNEKNWGYRNYKGLDELRTNYRNLIEQLMPLVSRGLAAAIYTQTTDVEIEVNGLMTYDREVVKLDVNETAALHRKLYPLGAGKR
jgi:beta-galactosidase/beta-glucuronidase